MGTTNERLMIQYSKVFIVDEKQKKNKAVD